MIEYFLDDLGIVFHTHRVEYPKVLSAQVLPRELKELAITRLENVKDKVKDFNMVKKHPQLLQYTLGQIQDNINYLNARDQSDKWQDCVEFNTRLDKTRSQSFVSVTPEFKQYVK
jgi:hypothetical protein